jgi:hypothetical protein
MLIILNHAKYSPFPTADPPSEAFEEALPEREGSDLAEPPSFAYIFQTSG